MILRIAIILPLVFLVIFIVVLSFRLTSDENKAFSRTPLLGKEVPEFSLSSIYQDTDGLSDIDLRKEFSLVNIFGSWCVMCRVEHPHIMNLSKKNILPIYGINWNDETEDAQQWLEIMGNPYNKIGQDKKGGVVASFGITGAPETFLIDENGKIIYRYPGPIDENIIKNEILPLIK